MVSAESIFTTLIPTIRLIQNRASVNLLMANYRSPWHGLRGPCARGRMKMVGIVPCPAIGSKTWLFAALVSWDWGSNPRVGPGE